jgi:hypothetical protein
VKRVLLIAAALAACTDGTPVPDGGPPPECRLNTDCPHGQFCASGFCTFECRDRRDCAPGELCDESGRCVPEKSDAGGCPQTACAVGTKRCAGDLVQTCEADPLDGCGTWGAGTSCGMGRACDDGECADRPCTSGEKRCTGGGTEQCVSGEWRAGDICPQGCADGACTGEVTCSAGLLRCAGPTLQEIVQVCNPTGSAWLLAQSCRAGCESGRCKDPCPEGARRCVSATAVEVCTSAGTWQPGEICSTACVDGICAGESLQVTQEITLSGTHVFAGSFTVTSAGRVRVEGGPLVVRARDILVEAGGEIVVAPEGDVQRGRGAQGIQCGSYPNINTGGGGGGYGAAGASSEGVNWTANCRNGKPGGVEWGSPVDAEIDEGSAGGRGSGTGGGLGGLGGGHLELHALNRAEIRGAVFADGENGGTAAGNAGGGGGGSGGGVLVAADELVISGSVRARGGSGGAGHWYYDTATQGSAGGGAGGKGRIKLLHGKSKELTTAVLDGATSVSLKPPLRVTSSSHPDPLLRYHDGAPSLDLSWERPFPDLAGYLWKLDLNAVSPPTPADGAFITSESLRIPAADLPDAPNVYFHVTTVDALANRGTVEGHFAVQINSEPPLVESESHGYETQWYLKDDVFLGWDNNTVPEGVTGYYYAWDHFRETGPGPGTGTFVNDPRLLIADATPGIWFFHVRARDTMGYLTQRTTHFRVNIGAEPGRGNFTGIVRDAGTQTGIAAAVVKLNRGLDQATAASDGRYSFNGRVYVGSWELVASAPGYQAQVQTVQLPESGATVTADFALAPQ